jgi:glutathione S-transferase
MVPALDVLEIALTKSPWLAGDDFTVADLNVASALYRGLSLDLGRWPVVTAWLHKCWDRPAAKRARAMRE